MATRQATGAAVARRIPRRVVGSYGTGSIATGVFTTVPGLLLLYYLTNTLAVPAWVGSILLFAPKAWDAILNPAIGRASDRSRSRWGRRRPFLLVGAIFTPLFFFALFATPDLGSPGLSALWVGIAFVLAMSGFAAFQVPWVTLPAELTDDYHERTRLMSVRMVLLTAGILVGGGVAPMIAGGHHGGRGGYLVMGAVVGAAIGAAMFVAWRGTRGAAAEPEPEPEEASGGGWRQGFADARRALKENPAFAALLSGYAVQSIAVGAMLAATPYVATYVLGDSSMSSVLFVCLVGPVAVCVPLWRRLSPRIGKLRGYLAATTIFALAAASLAASQNESHLAVFAEVAALGVGYAGIELFAYAMLPDAVSADLHRTGHLRNGLLTGLWQAGETIGLAVGSGAYALFLSVGGFVSSSADERVAQPPSAFTGIVLGFSALPAILVALSLPLLWRYSGSDTTAAGEAVSATPTPTGEPIR
jgi:Na+/melibiose symporter-like transporter